MEWKKINLLQKRSRAVPFLFTPLLESIWLFEINSACIINPRTWKNIQFCHFNLSALQQDVIAHLISKALFN